MRVLMGKFAQAMERVAQLGGANAPFELILEYVGGPTPSGREWQYIRSWRALCHAVSLAWMQYQRDVETVGPNAGCM